MAQDKRCDLCGLWVSTSDGRGECHAHAPAPVQQLPNQSPGSSEIPYQAPITTAEFWCGEFQQS